MLRKSFKLPPALMRKPCGKGPYAKKIAYRRHSEPASARPAPRSTSSRQTEHRIHDALSVNDSREKVFEDERISHTERDRRPSKRSTIDLALPTTISQAAEQEEPTKLVPLEKSESVEIPSSLQAAEELHNKQLELCKDELNKERKKFLNKIKETTDSKICYALSSSNKETQKLFIQELENKGYLVLRDKSIVKDLVCGLLGIVFGVALIMLPFAGFAYFLANFLIGPIFAFCGFVFTLGSLCAHFVGSKRYIIYIKGYKE